MIENSLKKQNKGLIKLSAIIGYLFLITQLINNLFFHSTHISTIRFPAESNYGNQLIPFQIICCFIVVAVKQSYKIKIERISWIIWLLCLINSVLLFSSDHQYYSLDFLILQLILFISTLVSDLKLNKKSN